MRAGGRRLSLALIASAAALLCVAPAAAAKGHKNHKGPSAVIRRSAYGIPHIIGRNWEDVGFGYGYAFAQDDICPMAEDYVTVRARRREAGGNADQGDRRLPALLPARSPGEPERGDRRDRRRVAAHAPSPDPVDGARRADPVRARTARPALP